MPQKTPRRPFFNENALECIEKPLEYTEKPLEYIEKPLEYSVKRLSTSKNTSFHVKK